MNMLTCRTPSVSAALLLGGQAGSAIHAVATAAEQEDLLSAEEALQAAKLCEEAEIVSATFFFVVWRLILAASPSVATHAPCCGGPLRCLLPAPRLEVEQLLGALFGLFWESAYWIVYRTLKT